MRPRFTVLAVALAATAIGAGPVAALASPSVAGPGRLTPAVTNPGDAEPSLALATGTNGAPKAAAVGARQSLWYYTVIKGHWHATKLGGAGTAYSGPSVISGPGANAAVAVEGRNHSLLLFVTEGSKWVKLTVAGKNSAYSVPSLALGPSGVAIAVVGKSNSLWYYWLGGGRFHSHEILGAAYVYSAPSLVIRNKAQAVAGEPVGTPDIAVEAGSHSLYYLHSVHGKWYNDLVPASNNQIDSAPALEVYPRPGLNGGEADIFAQGPGHSLAAFSNGRGGWGPYGASPLGPGNVYGAVSVVANLKDQALPVVIAYHGSSDSLGILLFNADATSPGWQNDPISTTVFNAFSAPALAVQPAGPAGQLDVIFQGAHNTLWFYKGPRPAVPLAPNFKGQRIGGPGSTFGG